MTALATRSRTAGSVPPTPAPRMGRAALILGALASLVSGLFSWGPSLWYDEGASVTAATRDLEALGVLVQRVDAVHALYYAMLHGWFELVGYSAGALRFPSVVAAGVGVALTVLLAARLGGGGAGARRLGILSGVVLMVLPRFTWAGGEGRSYAIGLALAAGSSLLLVAALQSTDVRRRRALWIGYGIVAALSIVLYLYLALVILAHGAALLVLLLARRVRIGEALPFAVTAIAAIAATLPLVREAESQKGQISWIHPLDATTPHAVLVTQFFPKAAVVAAVAWVLVLLGATIVVLGRRRRPELAAFSLALLVVPTAALLLASLLVTPLYSPRYLTFSLPALAILVAVVIESLPRRALRVTAVVLLLALIAPVWIAQRMPEAKQDADWNQIAALVADTSGGREGPEGIVWGGLRGHPTATSRVIEQSYPEAFAGVDDINASSPPRGLWERNSKLTVSSLGGYETVWYIVSNKSETQPEKMAVLAAAGFTRVETWRFSRTDVYLYER